jgi:hypothetical protein
MNEIREIFSLPEFIAVGAASCPIILRQVTVMGLGSATE